MKELRQQLVSALLMVITVAAVVAAVVNFQQQTKFHLPDDGVTWLDRPSDRTVSDRRNPQEGTQDRPVAVHIVAGSPGEKAGIHLGDRLLSIDGFKIGRAAEATQVLARLGPWHKAEYKLLHEAVEVPAQVIIGEAEHDSTLYYQYAAAAMYLGIGLYVYFRRRTAPHAQHLFLLCLASFVLLSFHYTGKLNNFDKVIYLGNLVAGYLAPSLLLHFAFVFPEPQAWIRKRGVAFLVYFPGLILFTIQSGFVMGWLDTAASLLEVRWLADRIWILYLCAMYLAGGLVLGFQRRRTSDPIIRRQLTWLRNGALVGIIPFAMIYALPYSMGVAPTQLMNVAVLSLPLIPLTWAYAILRYRLMDVDIIFQEGYVYTLATLSVLALFYGMIFTVGRVGELNGGALLAMLLVAAFLFQPIRNWLQEQLDRYYFYKDRYDYRRTLIEFGRELSLSRDVQPMLESVADRLIRTLGVRHVAAFVWDETQERFALAMASGREGTADELPYGLDLSFLSPSPSKPYLFFERTRTMLDVVSHELPTAVRRSIAELELTYYLPCNARGRTIAYLGVSRTESGDFLSSEDVELLVTLSGYVGIAIDNAKLYQSLEQKAKEYERLKEFSENIVESINVGILAADLDNTVGSWNSQMEQLTGITRQEAVGRRLEELIPADLCTSLDAARAETSVHNIYKYVLKPQEATLNIAVAPLVSRDGERIGRLIIFDNVTDRAELEKQLVQADKLSSIGLLAAGVAHEVNTPLAVISSYAQMLAKQISGDKEKAPLLEKIAKQTFRASEIVNSLLNFSRTSTSDFVSLDLNKVIRETLTLVEHQFAKVNIRTETSLEEFLPRVRGNAGKIQQVFLNLFLNAKDAMEGGGALAVSTSMGGGVVRVTVTDTGSGIEPDHVARIFDPFFTTKGATKKGTGLGLSVSYGIMQEHGGSIEVESRIGKGTAFVLTFPDASVAQTARPHGNVPARTGPAYAGSNPIPAVSSSPAPVSPAVPTPVVAKSDNIIR